MREIHPLSTGRAVGHGRSFEHLLWCFVRLRADPNRGGCFVTNGNQGGAPEGDAARSPLRAVRVQHERLRRPRLFHHPRKKEFPCP